MKTLADKLVTVACIVAAVCCAIHSAIREHNLKRRLGAHYEGPAAD